jgi:hypothetical protein
MCHHGWHCIAAPLLELRTSAFSCSDVGRLAPLDEVRQLAIWHSGLAHLAKDHRWYEIIGETMPEFDCRAFVVEDERGSVIAAQPVFFAEQDLVVTAPLAVRRTVRVLRRVSPRMLKLKLMMIGSAAGEGHLVLPDHALAALFRSCLSRAAQHHGAALIVWKDVPASYRERLRPLVAGDHGYARFPSMPATRLYLDFTSFEDYLQRQVSHSTRKDLRRKFRASTNAGIVMQVVDDPRPYVDEMLPLYEQVRNRSALQFERLTREFLIALGERMQDRTRVFLWRLDGRLVAFSLCLVHDGTLYDEYLGLDYRVALDLHLYSLPSETSSRGLSRRDSPAITARRLTMSRSFG